MQRGDTCTHAACMQAPMRAPCVRHARPYGLHAHRTLRFQTRRKYAWGEDEVNVLGKSPMAWFHMGLTIVDSIDTLMIAGLEEEYNEVSSSSLHVCMHAFASGCP